VIALSPGMAEGVAATGYPSDRIHMIPNSCDLDLFHPGPKDAELVEQFGLAGKFVVGYAGAIGPSNALEASVPQAAAELKARGRHDIAFLIAGDGKSLPQIREHKEREQSRQSDPRGPDAQAPGACGDAHGRRAHDALRRRADTRHQLTEQVLRRAGHRPPDDRQLSRLDP
jgi:glycosyltransferase involved in cell wall biosynthesis